MDPIRDAMDIPKWLYQADDQCIYGPYSSTEMQKWYKTGYFTDTMLMRTNNEECFHTLAEWIHFSNGQSPFLLTVDSFEHLVNFHMQLQMSQLILTPGRVSQPPVPYLMVPPNAARAPPANVQGFLPAAPGLVTYNQNPVMVAPAPSYAPQQPFSQPPSEPLDELPSTTSNTPDDCEARWNSNLARNSNISSAMNKFTSTDDAPWNLACEIGTDTMQAHYCCASTQTEPGKISMQKAIQLLSQLSGIHLEIEES